MKKLLFIAVLTFVGLGNVNAQYNAGTALAKGSWVIEANTGSFSTGSTAFTLLSIDGQDTQWTAGAEAGYFVKENLAIKAGFGYGNSETFTYKVGAKYYINGKLPVGIDFTGVSGDGFVDASYIGLQAGYAWFVAPNVSIEPTLRYNATLDEDKSKSTFQALIGFAFHF